MEFSPRFMFYRNLKKRSKKKKKGSKGSNVATPEEQCCYIVWRVSCQLLQCRDIVVSSVEIDRSEFCNVATSPRHRLRHHSRLQHQISNVVTSGNCHNTTAPMSRHQGKTVRAQISNVVTLPRHRQQHQSRLEH